MQISEIDWAGIERLRKQVEQCGKQSLQAAAQDFASLFADEFETVVLARVFAVLPYALLGATERAFASKLVGGDARLTEHTAVLCLLGTRGAERDWNDRKSSREHLAIPLLDRSFVLAAPMVAKLLADLEIELKDLDVGLPIATRQILGGRNGTFYVPDAQAARDDRGRSIIAAQDFARRHQVRTVFGMGGAYVDGTWVVAIIFCRELLERAVVDRFPSLISNFKRATAQIQTEQRIFERS